MKNIFIKLEIYFQVFSLYISQLLIYLYEINYTPANTATNSNHFIYPGMATACNL